MNFFIKAINKMLGSGPFKDFEFHRIIMQRYRPVSNLNKGWNEESFAELEILRINAKKIGHFFEETLLLLDELMMILHYKTGEDSFRRAYRRLKEIAPLYDLPDEEFSALFEKSYLHNKAGTIQKATLAYLPFLYDIFKNSADNLHERLYPDLNILCGKVFLKIYGLCGKADFEDVIETMFFIAIGYGNLRDVANAMKYYNMAIALAESQDDAQYYYIACARKLSICVAGESFGNTSSLDHEKKDVIDRLLSLRDKLGTTLNDLDNFLTDDEANSDSKSKKFRLERLAECVPLMKIILEIESGDIKAAQKYLDKIKESESDASGIGANIQFFEGLIDIYRTRYESEDQSEYIEETPKVDEPDIEDEPDDETFEYIFSDETAASLGFDNLLLYSRQFILCGQYNHARTLANQAYKIASSVYSIYHQAMALHSMGQIYEQANDIDKALKHYKLSLSMLESDKSCTNADVSPFLHYTVLYEIGNLLIDSEPAKAVEYLKKDLSIEGIPLSFENMVAERLVRALFLTGNKQEAYEYFIATLNKNIDSTKRRISALEDFQWHSYSEDLLNMIGRFLGHINNSLSDSLKIELYDALLFVKGIKLLSENAVRQSAQSFSDKSRELYNKLQILSKRKKTDGTLTDDSPEGNFSIYSIENKLKEICKEMVEKICADSTVDYAAVREAMPEGAVIVDFFDYDTDGDRKYCAWVYRKDSVSPEPVEICSESAIRGVLRDMAGAGGSRHMSELYNPELPYGRRMARLVWAPLVQLLRESDDIVLVPSGSLHHIAVGSLPADEEIAGMDVCAGSVPAILEECYRSLAVYSHARNFVNADDAVGGDIALFGGLDYGGSGDTPETSQSRGYISISGNSAPEELREWAPLPNSDKEVRSISFMWRAPKDNVYTGLRGTVDNFLSLSARNPGILHIATHGFCESRSSAANLPALEGAFRPMDLTGLILSNGNMGWMGRSANKREGIITAADIASMDLSGTNMAVLSACYTADGVIKSDGVYGLQRALKKAGVKSLVLSLWDEADEAGSRFMIEFYTRLKRGLPRRQAFQEAKREIRKTHPHPIFWAGMIMID